MPIYEFRCRDCGNQFEQIIRASATPACPSCKSAELERLLSTFAVATSTPRTQVSAAPCGACGDPRGPGACSMD